MFIRKERWATAILVGLMLLIASTESRPAQTSLKGRVVVEVLAELRSSNLEFIYSSGQLNGSERVVADPHASDPLGVAREILGPYQLGLSGIRPGLYVIVPLSAVQASIRGRIVNHLRQAIPSARIELLPSDSVHWSNERGEFQIAAAPTDTYTLRISAENFATVEVANVEAQTGEHPLEIALDPSEPELSEIIVAASRYGIGHSPSLGAFLLEGPRLAAQPSLGDDSIRALARLPGMSQNGYSAQSNVRGGEPGEVLILLDGFPLRQPFHLPGYHSFFSAVDPAVIEEAEVYTGGFPVRYGNRLSGVFDLQTISTAVEPRRALGLSFFNAMARDSGRFEHLDGGWLGVARAGTLKPLLGIFAPDAGDPSYSDVYGRAEFGDPETLKISGNLLWSRDELNINAAERGERAQIESRTRYLWLRADKEWSKQLAASVWLGHSRIDSVRHGTRSHPDIAVGSVDDSRASKLWDLRSRLSWQPAAEHWFEGGVEWVRENASYRYRAFADYTPQVASVFARETNLARSSDLEPERDRIALFAAHRWQITDEVTSEIGVRAQRILTKGSDREWIYDPRFSVRWQLTERTSLRTHWGVFHQADEIQELKVEDGLLNFPRAQRAEHFIAGIEHRLSNGIALRAEVFNKNQSSPRARFENVLDSLSLLPEIAPDRVRIAPDFTESRGLELSAAYARPEWTGWASVTWSKAYDKVEGADAPRSWNQTWALSGGLQWDRGPWQLGAVATIHSGWPTTRLIDNFVDEPYLEIRNGSRLPTYATLDVRAAYRPALDSGRLTLALELTNVLNRSNPCCAQLIGLPQPDGSTRLGSEQVNWLPLVPSLSVMWEF